VTWRGVTDVIGRAPLVVLLFALVVAVVGCGARPAPSPTSPAARMGGAKSETSASPESVVSVPSLDAIAAEHGRAMPLMTEALRNGEATSKPIELDSKGADTCYRAALASSAPVRAWFEDDKHSERGEPVTTTTNGLVPPRGPACARKGEVLKLIVRPVVAAGGAAAGAPVIARAIVWQSK